VDPLGEQVAPRARSRGQVKARNLTREFPVRLFGERAGDIARPQARLEVDDGDAAIEGADRGCHDSGGIALDEHGVRGRLGEDGIELADDTGSDSVHGLAGGHHVEVEVGHDSEEIVDLVEHLPVLGRDESAGTEAVTGFDAADERGYFDGFRTGAEDGEDCGGHGRTPDRENRALTSAGTVLAFDIGACTNGKSGHPMFIWSWPGRHSGNIRSRSARVWSPPHMPPTATAQRPSVAVIGLGYIGLPTAAVL